MAYKEAQRLDPSTDEAMEQADRVRTLIAASREVDGPPSHVPVSASTLPQVGEEDEDEDDDAKAIAAATAARAARAARTESKQKARMAEAAAAKAAQEATKAAVIAAKAAESAKSLISSTPSKVSSKSPVPILSSSSGPTSGTPERVPAAIAMGNAPRCEGDKEDGKKKAGWGVVDNTGARDSDSMSTMSTDTNVATQSLLPAGFT